MHAQPQKNKIPKSSTNGGQKSSKSGFWVGKNAGKEQKRGLPGGLSRGKTNQRALVKVCTQENKSYIINHHQEQRKNIDRQLIGF
jgi:hypothetical protein